MREDSKNSTLIPESFNIAGGKTIEVKLLDTIESCSQKGHYLFGDFNDASSIIRIAKNVPVDGEDFIQTDEDMKRTFWHELFHVFQFYGGFEMDESLAQVFSNFMYEFQNTQKYDLFHCSGGEKG